MSMTDLKALALVWVMGARKLPAAPALGGAGVVIMDMLVAALGVVGRCGTHITKSRPPSSFTHLPTAASRLSIFLTSMDPIPKTLDPFRAVAMSLAMLSVFSTLRPTMHASAPR